MQRRRKLFGHFSGHDVLQPNLFRFLARGTPVGCNNSVDSVRLAAQSMRICDKCRALRGPCVVNRSSVTQDCWCIRATMLEQQKVETPWPGFEFNVAIAICHACGLRLVPSGSRLAVWFCAECRPVIESVNDLYGETLIPLNRQAMLDFQWKDEQKSSLKTSDDVTTAVLDFVTLGLRRQVALHEHTQAAVAANCRAGRLTSPMPRWADYVDCLRGHVLLRSRRLHELLERFKVPATIAARVSVDLRN